MVKTKVISLDAFREKRRRERQQSREALQKLLRPSKKRIVIPYNPDDDDDQKNFARGFSAGLAAGRFSPKSSSAGYACGYFGGIAAREYRATVDWVRFNKKIRERGEVFDDERNAKPPNRPRLASQRVRDACISLDMMTLTMHLGKAGKIVEKVADRYGISTRAAFAFWDNEKLDFSKGDCFKPI